MASCFIMKEIPTDKKYLMIGATDNLKLLGIEIPSNNFSENIGNLLFPHVFDSYDETSSDKIFMFLNYEYLTPNEQINILFIKKAYLELFRNDERKF